MDEHISLGLCTLGCEGLLPCFSRNWFFELYSFSFSGAATMWNAKTLITFFFSCKVPCASLELPRFHDYVLYVLPILIHFYSFWNFCNRRFENKKICNNNLLLHTNILLSIVFIFPSIEKKNVLKLYAKKSPKNFPLCKAEIPKFSSWELKL